jgi:hypothetical protein
VTLGPSEKNATGELTASGLARRRLLTAGGVSAAAAGLLAVRPSLAGAATDDFAHYSLAGTFTKPQTIAPDSDATGLTLTAGSPGAADIFKIQDPSGNDLLRFSQATNGRLAFPRTGSGHGPLLIDASGVSFNGTFDPLMYMGYNHAGAPVVSGEPALALVIEGDYNDGSKRVMELYAEAFAQNGTTGLRPFFWQFKRDATTNSDFLTWSQIMGNPLRVVDPNQAVIADFASNRVGIYRGAVFRPRAGDSTDPIQVQGADGSVNIRADTSGNLVVKRLGIRQAPNVNIESFCVNPSDLAYAARTDADQYARFYVTAAGAHAWGPGNAATDANLYRTAAKQLKTDNQFIAGDGLATKEIDSTGLSSAQIDALFGTTPSNGTVVSDPKNGLMLVRQRGKWAKTGKLTSV